MDEMRYRDAELRYWQSEGVVPTERWLHLSRTGTRVRVQELGEGEPVLFVHGVSNSGTSWAPLAARMRGFRCLLLDRPGCGLSEPLGTRFDDVASFVPFAESLVADVVDALQLDAVHVVATSLGGYYALRGAAAHPDRVRRLAVLGWTVGAPSGPAPLVMRLSGIRSIGRLLARIPLNERAARAMLSRIGLRQALEAGRLPQEAVDWFRAQVNHTDTMRNEIDAGPPLMHPIRGMSDAILLADDVLARIRTPTSFLWGADDPFGGAAVARGFAPRVPGADLEIVPGSGHAVWMDHPDRVAATLAEFLEPSPSP